METDIHEIADRINRVSTYVADAAPDGFTFNQFLVNADEPLLFHTGPRHMFPHVSQAIGRVVPLDRLRWITVGHVESDERGAMNHFLAAAPHAQVTHGALRCMVSLDDMCDRAPRRLANGEVIDLGGKRVRHIDTPMYPTVGRLVFSSKRPQRPSSAVTYSRGPGAARRSPTATL